jgi:hypothetical protein
MEGLLGVPVRICIRPVAKVLPIHPSTQVKMCFITEEQVLQERGIVLYPNQLIASKSNSLGVIGWKQFLNHSKFVRVHSQIFPQNFRNRRLRYTHSIFDPSREQMMIFLESGPDFFNFFFGSYELCSDNLFPFRSFSFNKLSLPIQNQFSIGHFGMYS